MSSDLVRFMENIMCMDLNEEVIKSKRKYVNIGDIMI